MTQIYVSSQTTWCWPFDDLSRVCLLSSDVQGAEPGHWGGPHRAGVGCLRRHPGHQRQEGVPDLRSVLFIQQFCHRSLFAIQNNFKIHDVYLSRTHTGCAVRWKVVTWVSQRNVQKNNTNNTNWRDQDCRDCRDLTMFTVFTVKRASGIQGLCTVLCQVDVSQLLSANQSFMVVHNTHPELWGNSTCRTRTVCFWRFWKTHTHRQTDRQTDRKTGRWGV